MFPRNKVRDYKQKPFKNRYLYLIFKVFAITLPKCTGVKRVISLVYCYAILLSVIAAYVWAVHRKFERIYKLCTQTILFLDVTINAVLLVFNCYSIIQAVRRCDLEEQFYERVGNVYTGLIEKYKRAEIENSNVPFWVFTFIHLIFAVQVLNVHLSDSLDKFDINKFLLDLQLNWNVYMVLLNVLKIYSFNVALIQAFQALNAEMFYHISLNSVLDGNKERVDVNEYSVYCFFTKMHSDLMDLMVLVSKLYGLHVLLLCLMLILVTIQGLNLTLKSVLDYTPIFKGHQLLSSISVGLLMIIYIAFIILIVISCSHASEESLKTSTISSKILPELAVLPHETTFKKMILLFIAYNKYSENHYSALGFIEIDYETILILLECFSLYIVLILQFA